MLVIKLQLII